MFRKTRLHIFSSSGANASDEALYDKDLDENSKLWSAAMSRDGNYLALGLEKKVLIYNLVDIRNPVMTPCLLRDNLKEIRTQRLNFSLDGSKLITATRDGRGSIRFDLFDLRDNNKRLWCRATEGRKGTQVSITGIVLEDNSKIVC
jgi:hypothetical protein